MNVNRHIGSAFFWKQKGGGTSAEGASIEAPKAPKRGEGSRVGCGKGVSPSPLGEGSGSGCGDGVSPSLLAQPLPRPFIHWGVYVPIVNVPVG